MRIPSLFTFLLLLGLLGCDNENAQPKNVYPDYLQSVRTSKGIELSWYSPLILFEVGPEFLEKYVPTQSFELYVSKNDTLNFIKVEDFNSEQNGFEYPENLKGVNYFFKLKCLAKGAYSSFSNLIWVVGGQNPSMNNLLNFETDYSLSLGDITDDNNKLLYSRNETLNCCNESIMMFNINTQEETLILKDAIHPVFDPDEKRVAFTSHFGAGFETIPRPENLGILELSTGNIDTLTVGQNSVLSKVFPADGKSIVYLNNPYKQPEVISQVYLENHSIVNFFETEDDNNINGPLSISQNENKVSFRMRTVNEATGFYALDLESQNISPIYISTLWLEYRASYSHNGKYLAFVSDRSGNSEVWVLDLQLEKYYQLTGNKGGHTRGKLVWSINDDMIYTGGKENDKYGIYVVDFVP